MVRSGYDLATRQVEYAYQMQASPGVGKLELGQDHSLVRAFKASLVKGKPPEAWRIVVLRDQVGDPPIVMGTFVHTLGNRFLYFPAVNLRLGKWIKEGGIANATFVQGALLDHVTLDPPRVNERREGHLTLLGREGRDRHEWKFRTRPRDGWHYWFSLLSPTLDAFPRLPSLLTMVFSSGRADLHERHPDFASLGGVLGMELPIPPVFESSFVQLDVWVAEADTQGPAENLRPFPFVQEPRIAEERPEGQTANFHLLELGFPAGERVAVGVTSLAGRIRAPMLLRANLRHQS